MLYDLYARENLKSRPEWAHEILYRPLCEDFYRNREMTERYLPSYEGCTARQMKRMTHMEGFAMDIRATAASGQWTGNRKYCCLIIKRESINVCSKDDGNFCVGMQC